MNLRAAFAPVCLVLAFAVSGCTRDTAGNPATGGARVLGEGTSMTAPLPSAPAKRVYVQNFALDAEATEPRQGLIPRPRLFQQLTGEDPATHAQRVVDQMAAAVKQAEALVSLRVRKATAGTFRRPAAKATLGLSSSLAARFGSGKSR